MNKNMTKADFIRNCFCEVLEDGKIHRYREIYDYACTKSVGTTFEGQLDLRNLSWPSPTIWNSRTSRICVCGLDIIRR